MRHTLTALLLISLFSLPAFSQESAPAKEDPKPADAAKITPDVDSDQIYKEITVEDF